MIGFIKRVFGKTTVENDQTNQANSTETVTVEEPGKTPSNIKKGSCDWELCGCLCGAEDCNCC
jgi:hypothetical protein